MSFQIQGFGGTVAEVDGTTFRALRITQRPIDYASQGSFDMSQVSGTMAAALGATSEIYQFRWSDATRLAVLYRCEISGGANVAASAAALLAFEIMVARSWTVDGSGGTAATITGNNNKMRTSMASMVAGAMRICTTAALTAGTKTLDTQGIGNLAFSVLTGAITTSISGIIIPKTRLLSVDSGVEHPLVMAQNEGWIIRTGANAWPAGMTWNYGVAHAWTELAAY